MSYFVATTEAASS